MPAPDAKGCRGRSPTAFLASLDRDVRVVFVVRRGDRSRLDAFLGTAVAVLAAAISMWLLASTLVNSSPTTRPIIPKVNPIPTMVVRATAVRAVGV